MEEKVTNIEGVLFKIENNFFIRCNKNGEYSDYMLKHELHHKGILIKILDDNAYSYIDRNGNPSIANMS